MSARRIAFAVAAALAGCASVSDRPQGPDASEGPRDPARLPSRETISPETWADRAVTHLVKLRELQQRSAALAVTGAAGTGEAAQQAHDADDVLCRVVHDAREALSAEAFRTMLELAVQRRTAEAGAGTAELARRALDAHAGATTCGE